MLDSDSLRIHPWLSVGCDLMISTGGNIEPDGFRYAIFLGTLPTDVDRLRLYPHHVFFCDDRLIHVIDGLFSGLRVPDFFEFKEYAASLTGHARVPGSERRRMLGKMIKKLTASNKTEVCDE